MVSNRAKLYRRTKQHTEFGVSASNGSRDIARTKSWRRKKEEKKNERWLSHKAPPTGIANNNNCDPTAIGTLPELGTQNRSSSLKRSRQEEPPSSLKRSRQREPPSSLKRSRQSVPPSPRRIRKLPRKIKPHQETREALSSSSSSQPNWKPGSGSRGDRLGWLKVVGAGPPVTNRFKPPGKPSTRFRRKID